MASNDIGQIFGRLKRSNISLTRLFYLAFKRNGHKFHECAFVNGFNFNKFKAVESIDWYYGLFLYS